MLNSKATMLLPVVLMLCCTARAASSGKYPAVRDVWVSSVGREVDNSMGKTPNLKLKTIQEFAIVDFDLSSLRGKKVRGGVLHLHEAGDTKLRWIGVSTVSSQWEEGAARGAYQVDQTGHGASFKEASTGTRAWSYAGSDVTDVTFTNGYTLDHHTEVKRLGGGWLAIDLPDYIIQSLIAGDTYGLCVMDDGLPVSLNSFVHSRDSGPATAPYVTVDIEGDDNSPPAAPADLRALPCPERATLDGGAIALTFTAPKDAFCYFIEVNGKPLERWRTPRPKPGGKERLVIDHLPAGQAVSIGLVVADGEGNRSQQAAAGGAVSAVLPRAQDLPQIDLLADKRAGGPPGNGALNVWALPELVEVDPASGDLIHENDPQYRQRNAVWSGGTGEVSLFALQGEIVGFQLMLEAARGNAGGVGVDVSDLVSDAGTIPASKVELFREWCVRAGGKWQPEYAIPLPAGRQFDIPWTDNGIQGQRVQGIYVDVYVPFEAPAGRYKGKVTVSGAGARSLELPLALEVFPVAIPKQIMFYPELNAYGIGGGEGGEYWFMLHKLAHQHRSVLNVLSYSQNGGVHGHVPRVQGTGSGARVTDWSRFDAAVGPVCDGSAFRGLHRDGVPVPLMYLPFNENYPSPISMINYSGPQHGNGVRLQFFLNAPAIGKLFPSDYWEGITSVARQYAEHIAQKGWLQTEFQCYLNNKYNFRESGNGSSWWILDEPYHYVDWEMLREYGVWFLKGIKGMANEAGKPRIAYRGDISRPRWQRMWLKGIMDVMYSGGVFFDRWKRIEIMIREYPMSARAYGSCNSPERSSVETQAWCVKSFIYGGDGTLPWQTLKGQGALTSADSEGILVDARAKFGTPVASIRLKAMRRGEQDVEYQRLLMEALGYNREQMRALALERLNLATEFRQAFSDEAAAVSFNNLRESDFMSLTRSIAEVLRTAKPRSTTAVSPRTPRTTAPAPAAAPEVKGEEAYESLLTMVIETVKDRRLTRVVVDVMGVSTRARVVSADEKQLRVLGPMGEIAMDWAVVRPVQFYGIAARAAKVTDAKAHIELARYCLWKDLKEEAARELEAAGQYPELKEQAEALKVLLE